MSKLTYPTELIGLLEARLWPNSDQEANQQHLSNRISVDDVRSLIPSEEEIHLYPPPFMTLAEESDGDSACDDACSVAYLNSLRQIDADLALFIADFGAGSDAPIVLDCRKGEADPPVLGLRIACNPERTFDMQWVQLTPSFSEFVDRLRLWELPRFQT